MATESEASIVEYFSEHERHRCGYCGSSDTNYSHGMWAHVLTVQDYQDLIDRGWRRSGKYCYKPTMNMTCCPPHAIRCSALDFKMNKSHKTLIKRVNRYLIYGERKNKTEGDSSINESSGGENMEHGQHKIPSDIKIKSADISSTSQPSSCDVDDKVEDSSKERSTKNIKPSKTCDKKNTSQSTDVCIRRVPTPGKGADPMLPPCKKAKQIRKGKKNEKLGTTEHSDIVKSKGMDEKSLEDFLHVPDKAENPVHKLEIKLVQSTPQSNDFVTTFNKSHKVYRDYQMFVHKDPPEKPSKKQYERFLCDSPLQAVKNNLPMGYGSFHQHYILDGKLIAVGVVDILPSCVSSVYLYYDPEFSFLSLGTYTALREIAFVRELNKHAPDLKNYYMGFYIHSCPKMKYKGQYYPSFLVCPELYSWVSIEKCRPKLDHSRYCKLEDGDTEDKDSKIDVNKILVLINGEVMLYEDYKRFNRRVNDEAEVTEYATLTGRTCSQRMLLYRK